MQVTIFRRIFPPTPHCSLRRLYDESSGNAHPNSTLPSGSVPITNYGLTIAFSLGIFERRWNPFLRPWRFTEEQGPAQALKSDRSQ